MNDFGINHEKPGIIYNVNKDRVVDPATQINADISGSGSTTLNKEQD
jgi:hypothetical protein